MEEKNPTLLKFQINIENAVYSGEFQKNFPIGFYKEQIMAGVQNREPNQQILYQYGGPGE